MAQVYKMTLYVCDVEGNLSLKEIKNLIDNKALDGCGIACICHFADECVGEKIEFDCNMDINMIDCPTSAWNKYFKKENEVGGKENGA